MEGKAAIDYKKSMQSKYNGEVTTEKLKDALAIYQKTVQEYGNIPVDDEEFPLDVYTEKILPVRPLLSRMPEVFADVKTGIGCELQEIPLEEVAHFYDRAQIHLKDTISLEGLENQEQIKIAADEMYQKVEKPYSLYGGFSADAVEYISLNILILLVICISIAAPTYAERYQNGSDSILRSTEYGRAPLGICQTLSLFSVLSVFYLICMLIQIAILNFSFGAECLKTSMQMLFSAIGLVSLNIGQLQIILVFGGLISILCSVSFVLFVSAKVETTLTSMLIALVTALLPSVLYTAIGASWIVYLFPAAGVGLQNAWLYQVVDINFLTFSNGVIWVPYVMIGVAVIELVIFTGFSIYAYCKHRVG